MVRAKDVFVLDVSMVNWSESGRKIVTVRGYRPLCLQLGRSSLEGSKGKAFPFASATPRTIEIFRPDAGDKSNDSTNTFQRRIACSSKECVFIFNLLERYSSLLRTVRSTCAGSPRDVYSRTRGPREVAKMRRGFWKRAVSRRNFSFTDINSIPRRERTGRSRSPPRPIIARCIPTGVSHAGRKERESTGFGTTEKDSNRFREVGREKFRTRKPRTPTDFIGEPLERVTSRRSETES